jgi:carboxylate-amine ligase
MEVTFSHSEQSSVGIEWELLLVDLETQELAPVAAEVLEAVQGGDGKPVRKEFLPCQIEIVSSPRRTIAEAIGDISERLEAVREAAARHNAGLIGAGSHPFAISADQIPFRGPRYDAVVEKNGWWAKQMAICGTHVHVGIAERDQVLPVTWTFARFYPYLLALSASSPYWEGADSGYASQRTMLFQQLMTNGLPYRFETWAQFEHYVDDLVACGMIREVNELRWDVRPSPRFGTVENRIPDSAPTLKELACQAALTQALGEYFCQALAAGDTPDYLPPWLVRENKWRAARYGLDATVITPMPGERLLPLRSGLSNLIAFLQPYAESLDCVAELSFANQLITHGASYERQRRVVSAGGDLHDVVRLLLQENADNQPRFPPNPFS